VRGERDGPRDLKAVQVDQLQRRRLANAKRRDMSLTVGDQALGAGADRDYIACGLGLEGRRIGRLGDRWKAVIVPGRLIVAAAAGEDRHGEHEEKRD
jgi:hypothetical protein